MNQAFVVPDSASITFEVSVPNTDPIKMGISFKPESEGPRVVWQLDGDRLMLVFHGWKSEIGTALKKPLRLGKTADQKNIGFIVFHQRVADTNRLDFSLLIGGSYE